MTELKETVPAGFKETLLETWYMVCSNLPLTTISHYVGVQKLKGSAKVEKSGEYPASQLFP